VKHPPIPEQEEDRPDQGFRFFFAYSVGSFASFISVLVRNTYQLANGRGGQFLSHIDYLHTEKDREGVEEQTLKSEQPASS